MKQLTSYFAIILLICCQAVFSQNMQKEIEDTIDAMMKSSIDKDLEKSMSYWSGSKDFLLITDGQEYDINRLRELYKEFWANLEYQKVLKTTVAVTPIDKYKALCIWKGTESIKMKDAEAFESSWISTLIMENKKGGWVIIHGHTSHF